MMLESRATRVGRGMLAAFIVAAVHLTAIAWALHAAPELDEESQTGGAFIIELAEVTMSPAEENRDIAVGEKQEEVAPVAASTPQVAAVATPEPLEDDPVVPEAAEPPEDALRKRPEEKPPEEAKPDEQAAAQAKDAPAVAPVAASEAAAPQSIENAAKMSDTPRGQNAGTARIDRRAIQNWYRDLAIQFNRHKRYPSKANEKRQRGVVSVAFAMDRDGRVMRSSIAKTSGYEMLDQAALDMLRRASPLPTPPDGVPGSEIELVVPVNFRWRE